MSAEAGTAEMDPRLRVRRTRVGWVAVDSHAGMRVSPVLGVVAQWKCSALRESGKQATDPRLFANPLSTSQAAGSIPAHSTEGKAASKRTVEARRSGCVQRRGRTPSGLILQKVSESAGGVSVWKVTVWWVEEGDDDGRTFESTDDMLAYLDSEVFCERHTTCPKPLRVAVEQVITGG